MRSWARKSFLQVLVFGVVAGVAASGCGYSLRTSRTPSRLVNLGIRRIYVHPLKNETYRAGVENAVFNRVVRAVGLAPGLRAVASRDEADAELDGWVQTVQRTVNSEIKASELAPRGLGSQQILVATEYQASMSCRFQLRSIPRDGSAPQVVWSNEFTRARPFPGNNQLWSLGSTAALINESEFDRVLADVASLMGQDLAQSLAGDF